MLDCMLTTIIQFVIVCLIVIMYSVPIQLYVKHTCTDFHHIGVHVVSRSCWNACIAFNGCARSFVLRHCSGSTPTVLVGR